MTERKIKYQLEISFYFSEWLKMKKTLALLSLFSVAACSGSETTTVSTLWNSPTGSGAGLVRAKSEDQNSVALVQNVNDAGNYRSFEVVQVISETRRSDGSYTGEVVVRDASGQLANVTGVFYQGAAVYSITDGVRANIVAGGNKATLMPVGTYQFAGYAGALYSYGNNMYDEDGTFTMSVQFANKTAQLTADTAESRYTNNNLTFNTEGDITGSSGTFIVYANDGVTELERRTVDFDGSFHGSGATHVSGIAIGGSTTNDDFSAVAIVGKR